MAEQTKIYPKGINFFAPRQGAPEWVKGSIIISPNELFKWLKENPDLITEHEKHGKQIRLTATDKGISVDTWKPTPKEQPQEANGNKNDEYSDNLPF